jgi:thiol-disulfide isomerase/thioredoxin
MNRMARLLLAVLIAARSFAAAIGADRAPRVSADLIDHFETRAASSVEEAGVGIALARRDGRLFVGRVLPGTPAARCGMVHAGDRLLSVGQANQKADLVERLSIEKVVPLIRGRKGTGVILTLVPAGKTEIDAIAVPLVRGTVKALNLFGDGRRLPPGTVAPDLGAIVVPGGRKFDLASCRRKIVVLEFWASWCAPCLRQLDHLEDLRKQHPEWKDRVEFLAVGADENGDDALRCLQSRGKHWADLQVVWAGTPVLKPFHIGGLPEVYVLDRQGRIIAGEPKTDLATTINRALAADTRVQPPK